MPNPTHDYSGGQLTEAERQKVREIIERDERIDWLMAVIRRTAAWIAVVLAGIWVAWDTFVKILKGAVQ